MKRPEKKVVTDAIHLIDTEIKEAYRKQGYNQACDAYDNFLPGYMELEKLIRDIGAPQGLPLSMSQEIAHVITKRLWHDNEKVT